MNAITAASLPQIIGCRVLGTGNGPVECPLIKPKIARAISVHTMTVIKAVLATGIRG